MSATAKVRIFSRDLLLLRSNVDPNPRSPIREPSQSSSGQPFDEHRPRRAPLTEPLRADQSRAIERPCGARGGLFACCISLHLDRLGPAGHLTRAHEGDRGAAGSPLPSMKHPPRVDHQRLPRRAVGPAHRDDLVGAVVLVGGFAQ